MAPHDVISTCPVCADELSISRLHCRTCGTTLEGEFSVGRFGRLSREHLAVLESFLRSKGNLKEMERELGISYPTVRARVDALVKALGLSDGETVDEEPVAEASAAPAVSAGSADQRTILERLARHEISAEEASAALRGTSEA